jgi:hypothetical protein
MALIPFSMIHLGHSVDLDPTEGNNPVENASGLIRSYYGAGDPAFKHITTVTADNVNNDGAIRGDGFGTTETLTYDVGAGTVTTVLDFAATVNVTITFTAASGVPPYVGLGGIIQTAAGDLFLVMVDDDAGLGANPLNDAPLFSISVTSISSAGQNQDATASDNQQFVTCFVSGTEIMTRDGPVAVDRLQIGDLVRTADHGFQAIRWIGTSTFRASDLAANANLRPVRIRAGALGAGLPSRDLWVSRQHRMVVSCAAAKRMFDRPKVFITAIKLTGLAGITVDPDLCDRSYFHIMFDRHEVIFAEGAPTESFLIGPFALAGLQPEARTALLGALPAQIGRSGMGEIGLFTPDNRAQRAFVAYCARHHLTVQDDDPATNAITDGRKARLAIGPAAAMGAT